VKRVKGFTIVEVVVALTLLSLLMLAVLTALRTFAQTQGRIDAVVERNDELRIVSNFLRNHVAQALPLQLVGAPDVSARYGVFFVGQTSELVWVAPFVGGLSAGGLHVMRLSRNGDVLQLQLAPYSGLESWPDWSRVAAFPLLEQVSAFSIAYRGVGGNQWGDEWLGGLMTPRAVRLRIAVAQRFWPDLIVRLDAAEMAFQ
jgi:general secretion pathway protein J